MLPEHDVVVVDEAHELVDRVTGVATDELTPAMVERAAARARRHRRRHRDADRRGRRPSRPRWTALPEGRVVDQPEQLATALAMVRDAAREVLSEIGRAPRTPTTARARSRTRRSTRCYETAERLAAHSPYDVTWAVHDQRRGSVLRVAPLSVNGLLREALFGERAVVLTSATLELGGSFEPIARQVGLTGDDAPEWAGPRRRLAVRLPAQGILYVARTAARRPAATVPPPAAMDELAALVEAAGGPHAGAVLVDAGRRGRGRRDARSGSTCRCSARARTGRPPLVQQFAADPATCLFGTLSLWQGVDVPGEACQLVVIDRIPFPRPDDPLMSARSQAVADAGGNGFMTVSATHAALRLAQGAGRLIRRTSDRGVVAVLDSRLATARYAPFLRTSLPPFWATTDHDVAVAALRRLSAVQDGHQGTS